MNKKGALGDYVDLVYRLALIMITVAIIFGTYTFAFSPSVDVKDSEAIILQKKLYNCFNSEGDFDSALFGNSHNLLLEKCSIEINTKDEGRYYLKLIHLDENGNEIKKIESGDSGKEWVTTIIEIEKDKKNNPWGGYSPGFSNKTYSIVNQDKIENLNIEVWINEI